MQANEPIVEEYDSQDPIYEPFSQEELNANPARPVEYDDTPGTMEIEGVTDDGVPREAQPQQRQQPEPARQETNQEAEDADAYPAPEEAADTGDDGQGQEASDSSEWDAAMLQAAGLEESEAAARFGTPQALENAVRLMDERSISYWQQQEQFEQLQQRQQEEYQQQQQMQSPAADEDSEDVLELPEPHDGGEWSEEVVSLVQTIADHFNKKLAKRDELLESQRHFAEAYQEEKAREQLNQYVEVFDGFVDKLGDEWTPIFGKGSGAEMDLNSPEVQARAHLDTVSRQLELGREAQGLPPVPRTQLLERALRVAFPQQHERLIRKQVENQVATRQRQFTSRPGNTMKRQQSGDDRAVSYAEKWYAERGLGPQIGDEFEYEEI
jgi:hypothetical protein